MRAFLFVFASLAITRDTHAFSPGRGDGRFPARARTARSMAVAGDDDAPPIAIATRRRALASCISAGLAAATSGLALAPTVGAARAAEGSRTLGKISGSGLVFKDTLVVEAFDDPKVKGVTLYVSNFERPMTGATLRGRGRRS